MGIKSITFEHQAFPEDDFQQQSFDDVSQDSSDDFNQDSGNVFSQDLGFDEFAQHEVPEVVKHLKKKR